LNTEFDGLTRALSNKAALNLGQTHIRVVIAHPDRWRFLSVPRRRGKWLSSLAWGGCHPRSIGSTIFDAEPGERRFLRAGGLRAGACQGPTRPPVDRSRIVPAPAENMATVRITQGSVATSCFVSGTLFSVHPCFFPSQLLITPSSSTYIDLKGSIR
jgi:hypothetical protein